MDRTIGREVGDGAKGTATERRVRFSVVIPTYNYGHYLPRAIDSVLCQAGDDLEVLVVDDGSTDDTAERVRAYGDRIRYFHQSNQGPFVACRRGLSEAQGDYLIFLDADDRLIDNAVALLRQAVHADPELRMVIGRYWRVAEDGRRELSPEVKLKSPLSNFLRYLDGELAICTGAAVMHRAVFERVRRHEVQIRTGMDIVCIAQTLLLHPCAAIDAPLLEVHSHPGRLRDNVAELRRAGVKIVDDLFNSQILPEWAHRYRRRFQSRVHLSRARSFYKAGSYAEARDNFLNAVRYDWRAVTDLRNLRRFANSLLRSGLRAPATADAAGPTRRPAKASGGGRFFGHRRAWRQAPLAFLEDQVRQHGDLVLFRLHRPTLLTLDREDVEHILLRQAHQYQKSGFQQGFSAVFGQGLFLAEGAEHHAQRHTLQPLFHRTRISDLADPLVELLQCRQAHWQAAPEVVLDTELRDCVADAAGKALLGIEDRETIAGFQLAYRNLHRMARKRWLASWTPPAWLPTRAQRRENAELQRLDTQFQHAQEVSSRFSTLADHLKLGLPPDVAADNLRSLFLAMYEPVANTIAWGLYELARHPRVLGSLRAELSARLGSQSPTTADLRQLPYLDLVVNETLRLYPSTAIIARRPRTRERLPSGVVVGPEMDVYLSPYLMQRDERWFEAPLRFLPERFEGVIQDHRAAHTFLPFGLGPRNCLGEGLARAMLGLALASVAQGSELELANSAPIAPESLNGFTIQASQPIRARVLSRTAATRTIARAA